MEQSSKNKQEARIVVQEEPKAAILINVAKSKLPAISEGQYFCLILSIQLRAGIDQKNIKSF